MGKRQLRAAARALGKKGARKGGLARAAKLTPERRVAIARKASAAAADKRKAVAQEGTAGA